MKSLKTKERSNLKKDSYQNLIEGAKIWAEYFRKNPHRFCTEYLGINLYPFQMILIYMMNICTTFAFIACRGLGKSFLTAVFCCCRAILYPGSKIILASGNKKQSSSIITEKIAELRHKHPMLDREIEEIKTNHDDVRCVFKNGSTIVVVAANDGARSKRGNVIVADEFRMIKETIINTVLKQFLTNPRKPPFLEKPEYKDYPLEQNKEIYLTSAYLKSHWSYNKFINITKRMCEGKPSFSCDIPYLASLDHKLLLKEKIEEDRSEIGEFSYRMEYEGEWYGQSENSFYSLDEINRCRVLTKAYYPLSDDEYRNKETMKKRLKQMNKKNGEIRIISCDIAVSKSTKNVSNDNSVYTLMRLLPSGDGFVREIVHMEAYNGLSPEEQSIRIKRLFTEFNADKIIIDAQGIGYSVLNELFKSTYDKSIDEHYEPFIPYASSTSIDLEYGTNGKPVIYIFKGYEASNNQVNVYLKNAFMSKKIRLLIDENEKKSDFADDKDFHMDGSIQANKLMPFIQTSQFIFETINLEYEVRPTGNIAIKEKSGHRKDRFSSVGYANYLAQIIEDEEYRKRNKKGGGFMFFN